MYKFRGWIGRCSWLAGVLLLGCAIFGSLWSGLAGMGDAAGATFCQGVFWGGVFCWSLNGITLMGLLTAVVLVEDASAAETQSTLSASRSE